MPGFHKDKEHHCSETQSKNVFKGKLLPQIIATLAATLSAFGMGSVEAYTSPALPDLMSDETQPLGPISRTTQGQMASFALLAALISGPVVGSFVNKVGRRCVLIMLSFCFITGWTLMAASENLLMFFIGRILTGFAAGGVSLAAPIYVGEISEKRCRGLLGFGFQIMATLGISFAYVVGTFVNWRWLAVSCNMAPILGLILLLYVPPSPRYLLSKKKNVEAMASLMWLRGASSAEQVLPEFISIEANLTMYAHKKKSMLDVFKMRTVKPMTICLLLLLFQQLSGIEAILMYTVHIFREAGSNIFPNYCAIIVGVLQVLSTTGSATMVEKAGRRKLLLTSLLGVALSTMTLGVFFYMKGTHPSSVDGLGCIPLLCLGSYITFFALGIGPVPFLLIAELNSPQMVGLASAIGTSTNWGFGYLATFGMISIENSLGVQWCFAAFSGISIIGGIFVWFFCPETKGRSMEEIQRYFQNKKKAGSGCDTV